MASFRTIDFEGLFDNCDFALIGGYFTTQKRDFSLYAIGEVDIKALRTKTILPLNSTPTTKRDVYLKYLTLDPQFTRAYEDPAYLKRLEFMSIPSYKVSKFDSSFTSPPEFMTYLAETRLKCLNSLFKGDLTKIFLKEDESILLKIKAALEEVLGANKYLTDIQSLVKGG